MPSLATIEIHPATTDRRGLGYQFTPKHHGADFAAAQWLPTLTLHEEFAVFNVADQHDFCDDRGWLYGIGRQADRLMELGTCAQQIAEFPLARTGENWHGYPIWPVNGLAPSNRRGEKMRPAKLVFEKMEHAGLLTARMRKRLFKGDHV